MEAAMAIIDPIESALSGNPYAPDTDYIRREVGDVMFIMLGTSTEEVEWLNGISSDGDD